MIFTRRTRRLGTVALGATILGGAAAATLAVNPTHAMYSYLKASVMTSIALALGPQSAAAAVPG